MHHRIHGIDTAYCYRPSGVVCMSVCLCVLGTRVSCAKTVEPVDREPRIKVLDEGPHIGATWRIR